MTQGRRFSYPIGKLGLVTVGCGLVSRGTSIESGRLQELRFAPETTFDYFESTRRYLERHGKPVAFYSDKFSVFRVNAKDAKSGDGVTQFGRALGELNIDIICANTAAAKGRVERANLTLQDRLVKELRLRGISTVGAGNAFLPEFGEDYNRRFACEPQSVHDAHRPLLAHESLAQTFTVQENRKVSMNLTLHYNRVMYLLDPSALADSTRGKHVQVREHEDGAVRIYLGDVELAARPFPKDNRVTQGGIVSIELPAHNPIFLLGATTRHFYFALTSAVPVFALLGKSPARLSTPWFTKPSEGSARGLALPALRGSVRRKKAEARTY